MKFKMIDGHVYSGRTYRQVVAAMAGDKLRRPRTLENYRRGVRDRVADALEATIDASTDTSFIQTMEAAGLMERIK